MFARGATMGTLVRSEHSRRAQGSLPTRPIGHGVGIHHILVCLDRSPSNSLCLAHALSLANTFGSVVTLLHVAEHPHDRFGPHATDALGWEISRQEASAHLEQFQKEAERVSGLHVGVRLEQGHPAERIVALTRELGADLVVLGSHGESGQTAWSLGSTTQQVLATARSSVLVARGRSSTATFAPPRRILAPLDGSIRTESVVPIAAGIASANGGELLLVHVVAEPLPSGVLYEPEDLELASVLASHLESRAAQYLDTLRQKISEGERGSPIRTLVARQSDDRQFLIDLADREQIDLIVLLAHGSTCNAARPFGSVASHLLTHSTVALLVLQDLPASELRTEGDVEPHLAPPLRSSYPPEGA
jgi:nucleotide-binding universal stress UspA family protein